LISYRLFGLAALSVFALAACQHELAGGAGPALTNASAQVASAASIGSATYTKFVATNGAPTAAKFATGERHFLTRHLDAEKRIHTVRLWQLDGDDARLTGEWQVGAGWNETRFKQFDLFHTAVTRGGTHVAMQVYDPKNGAVSRIEIIDVASGRRWDGLVDTQARVGCGLDFVGAGETLYVCARKLDSGGPADRSIVTRLDGANTGAPSIALKQLTRFLMWRMVVPKSGRHVAFFLGHHGGALGNNGRDPSGPENVTYVPLGAIREGYENNGFHSTFTGNRYAQLSFSQGSFIYLSPAKRWIVNGVRHPDKPVVHISTSNSSGIEYSDSETLVWGANVDETALIGLFGTVGRVALAGPTHLIDVARVSAPSGKLLAGSFADVDGGRGAVFVFADRIVRTRIDRRRLDAAGAYRLGLERVAAGFGKAGVEEMKKAMAADPDFAGAVGEQNLRMLARDIGSGHLKMEPGDFGEIALAVSNAIAKTPSAEGGADALALFGIMAFRANQPGVLRQTEARLRQLPGGTSHANLLAVLVRIASGQGAGAYDEILSRGGLPDRATRDLVLELSALVEPLYREKSKLAYLLEMKESELPSKYSFAMAAPKPYPDLSGQTVRPAGSIPPSGAPVLAPSSSPTQSAPRPAAISGGGQVLD